MQIVQRPKVILEFYINFDCSMQHVCLVERMVGVLHRIVVEQMYLKAEFGGIVSGSQEQGLRLLCIEVMAQMISGLVVVFDGLFFEESGGQ